EYLPDEGGDPTLVDKIILALEELDLPLRNDPDAPDTVAEKTRLLEAAKQEDPTDAARSLIGPESASLSSRDPIRMYLSQMGNIPLLAREDEIFLAKQIEITRKRFRRTLVESDFVLGIAVDTLEKVHAGELPFERTLRTSETENSQKEQILGRMPLNLPTLRRLMEENRADFEIKMNSRSSKEREAAAERM